MTELEPKEPQLTPEQIEKAAIMAAPDAEQLSCKVLRECGDPVAWTIYRSRVLARQVVEKPEYIAVKDAPSTAKAAELAVAPTIGYARWGERLTAQNINTKEPAAVLEVVGQRAR